MQGLLSYFDRTFDPNYRVHGARLRDLFSEVLSTVDPASMPEFGTAGDPEFVDSESDRFVRFFYRPHLFPEMDDDLRRAHQLQFQLLPRELPDGAPVRVAAVLESYCHLSGDLFGWEMLRDGNFLIWIADLSGHGVRSGLCAAVLKILIDRAHERSQIDRLASEIDAALLECKLKEFDPLFATAFFMVIGPDGRATYCSAGHPPVFLRRDNGTIEELDPLSIPLGLLPGGEFKSRELAFQPGDALVLYTDGLVETKSVDGEMFGADRVRDLVRKNFDAPEEMTGSIYRELASRQELPKLDDDVTFLVARFDKSS